MVSFTNNNKKTFTQNTHTPTLAPVATNRASFWCSLQVVQVLPTLHNGYGTSISRALALSAQGAQRDASPQQHQVPQCTPTRAACHTTPRVLVDNQQATSLPGVLASFLLFSFVHIIYLFSVWRMLVMSGCARIFGLLLFGEVSSVTN